MQIAFYLVLVIALFACHLTGNSITNKNLPFQKTDIARTITPRVSELATDFAALSEIELAYEIAASIDDVIDAIEIITEMQEQSARIQTLVEASQGSIARTDDLVRAYVALYAEISPESVESLLGIQADLDAIASELNEIVAVIGQDAGKVVELTEKLEQTLMRSDIKEKAQAWPLQVQSQIDAREKTFLQIQPQTSQVAHHRVGAFTQAYQFFDAYQAALEDGKFSLDELSEIRQIGANAQASLYSTGDPQLFDIPVKIKVLTSLAIRGQWAEARNAITELQRSLPARPQP